jgi:hypothetical protein
VLGVLALGVIAAGGLAIYATLVRTAPKAPVKAAAVAAVTMAEPPRREIAVASKIDEIQRTLDRLPPEKPNAKLAVAKPKEQVVPVPAVKMTSAAWRELDQALASQVKRCWTYPKAKTIATYAPKMKVVFGRDGALSGTPVLINSSTDPAAKVIAESAKTAMGKCKTLAIPARFQAFYDEWKVRVIHFDVVT